MFRQKFGEDFNNEFFDLLIVRIKISFRGHLLCEFGKNHRLHVPCAGRSSEKTFNAEFFDSLIVHIEISSGVQLLSEFRDSHRLPVPSCANLFRHD